MDPRRWERACGRDTRIPLRIEADLAAPLVGAHPWVHLDAALTQAALHYAHYPHAHRRVSPTSADTDIREIPLPLDADRGVWCCSVLQPAADEPAVRARTYAHQRPAVEYAHLSTARSIVLTHGATMARRTPLTLWAAGRLTAYLVGDPTLVARLLDRIPAVGKKRSQGYGRVVTWRIEADAAAAVLWRVRDGRAARPLPSAGGRPTGVRPPYWYRPWWQPGVAAGERIEA